MRDKVAGIILAVAPTVAAAVVGLMWHSIDHTTGYAILWVCVAAFIVGVYLLFTSPHRRRTGIINRGNRTKIEGTKVSDQDTGILNEGDDTEIKDTTIK
jgi:hypothetical protein